MRNNLTKQEATLLVALIGHLSHHDLVKGFESAANVSEKDALEILRNGTPNIYDAYDALKVVAGQSFSSCVRELVGAKRFELFNLNVVVGEKTVVVGCQHFSHSTFRESVARLKTAVKLHSFTELYGTNKLTFKDGKFHLNGNTFNVTDTFATLNKILEAINE